MLKEKFCTYMQQNVVVSDFNNHGECACLDCRKKECNDKQCRALIHSVKLQIPKQLKSKFDHIVEMNPNSGCQCTECINATLYDGNQR